MADPEPRRFGPRQETWEEREARHLAKDYTIAEAQCDDGAGNECGITRDMNDVWRFCKPLSTSLIEKWLGQKWNCSLRINFTDSWCRVELFPRSGFDFSGSGRDGLPRFKPGRVVEDMYLEGAPYHLTIILRSTYERPGGLTDEEKMYERRIKDRFLDSQGRPVTIRGNVLFRDISSFTTGGGFVATIARGWPWETPEHQGIVEAITELRRPHHGGDWTISL